MYLEHRLTWVYLEHLLTSVILDHSDVKQSLCYVNQGTGIMIIKYQEDVDRTIAACATSTCCVAFAK